MVDLWKKFGITPIPMLQYILKLKEQTSQYVQSTNCIQ